MIKTDKNETNDIVTTSFCGACEKSCPTDKGFYKLGQFLCSQCVETHEICDLCGKIIQNSHVWIFKDEESGSYCRNCFDAFTNLEDLTKEAILAKLKARNINKIYDLDNAICIIWGIEDILTLRPALSRAKAVEILEIAKKRHEANFCMMLDLLDAWVNELYPEISTIPLIKHSENPKSGK